MVDQARIACAVCAARHVGWDALRDPSWAIIDLRKLAARTVEALDQRFNDA